VHEPVEKSVLIHTFDSFSKDRERKGAARKKTNIAIGGKYGLDGWIAALIQHVLQTPVNPRGCWSSCERVDVEDGVQRLPMLMEGDSDAGKILHIKGGSHCRLIGQLDIDEVL
jgi:hypothetical protein